MKTHHVPVEQMDIRSNMTVEELLDEYRKSGALQAGKIAKAADVWLKMLKDKERTTIFIGVSGALTSSGEGKLIADLMHEHKVDVAVCTGASLFHDTAEAFGVRHIRDSNLKSKSDAQLGALGYDRIYDHFGSERGYRRIDKELSKIMSGFNFRKIRTTRELARELGYAIKEKQENTDRRFILSTAAEEEIPIFIPAIADSSLAYPLAMLYGTNLGNFRYSIGREAYELGSIVAKSKSTGVIFLGGGVSKNYAQHSALVAQILFNSKTKHKYGFQINLTRENEGSLSGATLSEGKSWGKYGARAAMVDVMSEVSVAFPPIAAYVMSKLSGRRDTRLSYQWGNLGAEKIQIVNNFK